MCFSGPLSAMFNQFLMGKIRKDKERKRNKYLIFTLLSVVLLFVLLFLFLNRNENKNNWASYFGDDFRSHFSSLDQINTNNAGLLKVAWEYSSGGADTNSNLSQIQCNPLIIDGILYGVSANTQVFALEASTGMELWKTKINDENLSRTRSRGVTYWRDGKDQRIFYGAGKWLYCINAEDGNLIEDFGRKGRIDLQTGLQRPGAGSDVSSNTPNTIFKNLIIVGCQVSESEDALLGDIRAFDIKTGDLKWTFHTIPGAGETGYETWDPPKPRERIGGANNWMGMAIDRNREIIYVPTGSATPDFDGSRRKGSNLFANCLLAIDANSGKLIWYQQLVHHDLWDRDPPSPPNLLTVKKEGKAVDVVAQVTKYGYVYVFDRENGKPIFPVKEKPVPQDGIPGEFYSPTQPIPELPLPFTRQSFTENDFNSFVADRDSMVRLLRSWRTGEKFIPLVTDRMTIIYPGTDGGAQWGGAATDPDGYMYIPAKEIPVYSMLVPSKVSSENLITGESLYKANCSACHGEDLRGSGDGFYPALSDISKKLNFNEIDQIVRIGRGMMPSFSRLSQLQRKAIISFLSGVDTVKIKRTNSIAEKTDTATRYSLAGYNRWYDSEGYPVSAPPWGTLTCINLNNGERVWQVPLGIYQSLVDRGIPPTGTDNYGGCIVTGGGLVIIAGTPDEIIRIFDKKDGKLLWQHKLPAAGFATPSTYYDADGKQYIVIACGGGKLKAKSGDKYVAFALP